jgi:putative pyoverdin transport system ATP-binding/permease protein
MPIATLAKLSILVIISSSATAAILPLVNFAISNHDNVGLRLATFLGFAVAIVSFKVAYKSLIMDTSFLAESIIHSMRLRFLERIQSVSLRDVERLNRDEIYVCVNSEMDMVSDAAQTSVTIVESTLILLLLMGYLLWLSLIGFLCVLIFVLVATFIQLRESNRIDAVHQEAFTLQGALTEGFTDLLEGFKEVKMSTARSTDLVNSAKGRSYAALKGRMTLHGIFANNRINSELSYFGLIMSIVFLVPIISNELGQDFIMTTVGALYLVGPLFNLINAVPSVQKINAASKTILAVEARLGEMQRPTEEPPKIDTEFHRISLNEITFQYQSDDEFQMGPINLDVYRGQIVFITGGNGSGKSTFLKLLTGLYSPDQGVLSLDGQPITQENASSYRNLFSVIFSDNHLFKILYGIHEPDLNEASELFRLMELEHKTKISGNVFETIDLSRGQRKRLALIVALLEHRPICVFDEWAADQDVYFRQKFYRVILPWLRELGKTIIVVTHDEKYFDAADRRIDLENGKARSA